MFILKFRFERRELFLEFIHAPSDPGFHDIFAEVQQVSQFASRQPQVGLDLFLMGCGDVFD